MKKITTDKFAVITCYGANGEYDVRVPAGTKLTVHRHLQQPILMSEKKISESAYKKFYAPPAPKQKAKPKKDEEDK